MTITSLYPSTSQATTSLFVAALARFADLPLSEPRLTAVCAVLGAWIDDANALSLKMSAPAYQALVPATIFSHPAGSTQEA